MNISGIRSYSAMYPSYDVTKNSEIAAANIAPEIQSDTSTNTRPEENFDISADSGSQSSASRNSAEFASQYDPNATYEMKGADSDIASLDEPSVISQQQKNQIFQQYQLFVGSSQSSEGTGSAMAARPMEDFSLSNVS